MAARRSVPAPLGTGDRLLVFAYLPASDKEHRLVIVDPARHLGYETTTGKLSLPFGLTKDAELAPLGTLAEVVEKLKGRVGR